MATTTTQALAAREATETLPARIDAQTLIANAVDRGASIEVVERLVQLAKDVQATAAREAWYAAMARFQASCPPIKKTKTAKIQGRGGGGYNYTFAPLDEITTVVGPVMGELGLSYAWRLRFDGDRVVVNCRVSHTLGHYEESGDLPMPISQGSADGMGATPPQRVGIATTYGKRYTLLAVLGLAPEEDDDAEHADEPRGQTAPPQGNGGQSAHGQDLEGPINEQQIRRLSAIATGAKWSDEQVHELISGYQYNSRKDIRVKDYEAIVEKLKLGPEKALQK